MVGVRTRSGAAGARWKGTAIGAAALLAACSGAPLDAERAARDDLGAVRGTYPPAGARDTRPALTGTSPLADYLRFAMLSSPSVEAAYHDWSASVERITTARSLPDPRLTFEADIADLVMSLVVGLMVELPGPGKLRLAGEAAAHESRVRYFAFEREVLRAARSLKDAYYRLRFLAERLRVERETLDLLGELESLASQQNAAGRASLQDVLRIQIERAQTETRIANLEDSRAVLVAGLKAALGLGPGDPDPPIPERFEASTDTPQPEALLATALRRNPDLRMLEADVRRAESALALAGRAGVPDFAFGLDVDLDANPTILTPRASATLPIWRDKLAAQIAGAQAEKRSAEARLSAEQVRLAAELASMLYMYRESVRNEALLVERIIPRARQSLDAARAGYVTARSSFLDLIDAERSLLAFELALVEARTQRELALAALSLAIAGVPPGGAPVLGDAPETDPVSPNSPEVRP